MLCEARSTLIILKHRDIMHDTIVYPFLYLHITSYYFT